MGKDYSDLDWSKAERGGWDVPDDDAELARKNATPIWDLAKRIGSKIKAEDWQSVPKNESAERWARLCDRLDAIEARLAQMVHLLAQVVEDGSGYDEVLKEYTRLLRAYQTTYLAEKA